MQPNRPPFWLSCIPCCGPKSNNPVEPPIPLPPVPVEPIIPEEPILPHGPTIPVQVEVFIQLLVESQIPEKQFYSLEPLFGNVEELDLTKMNDPDKMPEIPNPLRRRRSVVGLPTSNDKVPEKLIQPAEILVGGSEEPERVIMP